MKSLILTGFLIVCFVLYVSGTTISFKPFAVSFKTPIMGWALLFIVVGFMLYGVGCFREGRKYQLRKSISELKKEVTVHGIN